MNEERLGSVAAEDALEALRLCEMGRVDAAIDRYRRALAATEGEELPVGLHVMRLRGAGYMDAAARVQRAAIDANADVSLSWALRRRKRIRPADAAAEYESLFAHEATNARMVNNYLVALSRAGAADRLGSFIAADLLFRCTTLGVAGGPVGGLLDEVAAALRGSPGRRFADAEYSARGLERVHRTHCLQDPPVVELHRRLRPIVSDYLEVVASSRHMLAALIPTAFELRSWAVISDGTGYVVPHIHSRCWVSGVVYVEGPESSGGDPSGTGVLRVGASPAGDPRCPGWPSQAVVPVPGTVVLMPAFYTHWVTPIAAAARRISVAFNVVPATTARSSS